MYSEGELESAIAAGAIDQKSADAFRQHVESSRSMQREDQEHFRLITSFNDIFVSIAAILLLIAAGSLGQLASDAVMGIFVAITAWGLAEYFTAKKHMALPSIILVGAFTFGVVLAVGSILDIENASNDTMGAILAAATAAITCLAAWVHWRRFQVPITIAALTAAGAASLIAIVASVIPDPEFILTWLVLIAGIVIFVIAMRWDISDRSRTTRRSDVAFWLHLLAAPAIAHPIFSQLGVFEEGALGTGNAIIVLALYVAFGLVALAIDRRAILVSGLAYVLFALSQLFRMGGNIELEVALTTLIIGSALLLLSAFWNPIRSRVVGGLPENLKNRLPATGLVAAKA